MVVHTSSNILHPKLTHNPVTGHESSSIPLFRILQQRVTSFVIALPIYFKLRQLWFAELSITKWLSACVLESIIIIVALSFARHKIRFRVLVLCVFLLDLLLLAGDAVYSHLGMFFKFGQMYTGLSPSPFSLLLDAGVLLMVFFISHCILFELFTRTALNRTIWQIGLLIYSATIFLFVPPQCEEQKMSLWISVESYFGVELPSPTSNQPLRAFLDTDLADSHIDAKLGKWTLRTGLADTINYDSFFIPFVPNVQSDYKSSLAVKNPSFLPRLLNVHFLNNKGLTERQHRIWLSGRSTTRFVIDSPQKEVTSCAILFPKRDLEIEGIIYHVNGWRNPLPVLDFSADLWTIKGSIKNETTCLFGVVSLSNQTEVVRYQQYLDETSTVNIFELMPYETKLIQVDLSQANKIRTFFMGKKLLVFSLRWTKMQGDPIEENSLCQYCRPHSNPEASIWRPCQNRS